MSVEWQAGQVDDGAKVSIFGTAARTDSSPRRHAEPAYAFMRRVAGDAWDRVRELIESWLSVYPEAARKSLVARLRSGDDRDFASAFWELYLHEMYRRDGWQITIEPAVPASDARPDFLVQKDAASYYVEARCIFESGRNRGADKRLQTVYDSLNKLNAGAFSLSVHVRRIGDVAPSTRELARSLEDWLAALDPDQVALALKGYSTREKREWRFEGWHLVFEPLPLKPEARDRPDRRALGMFGSGGSFVDDVSPLRRALSDKGGKYGELDHPLVIAVNIISDFHDDDDSRQALFGIGDWERDLKAQRSPNIGYWGSSQSPQHAHVAGVLLALSMHHARVAKYAPTYWPHPGADVEVDRLALWPIENGTGRQESTSAAIAAHVHFGLPADWPGELFPRNR
jgi:hypothetical protein